jgi:hypothetical protein
MTRNFGFNPARFLGSANTREASGQAQAPSGIQAQRGPTTFIPPMKMSSRPALGVDGGGGNMQAGSLGAGTQYNPHAANVIQFPSGRTFLPDSRASERELSIDNDTCAICVTAVVLSFMGAAVGVGIYFGSLVFNFFDFG